MTQAVLVGTGGLSVGTSGVLFGVDGSDCCCETPPPTPCYRYARKCSDNTVADPSVGATCVNAAAIGGSAFLLGVTCYYFDFSDPTYTDPPATVISKTTVDGLFFSCSTCGGGGDCFGCGICCYSPGSYLDMSLNITVASLTVTTPGGGGSNPTNIAAIIAYLNSVLNGVTIAVPNLGGGGSMVTWSINPTSLPGIKTLSQVEVCPTWTSLDMSISNDGNEVDVPNISTDFDVVLSGSGCCGQLGMSVDSATGLGRYIDSTDPDNHVDFSFSLTFTGSVDIQVMNNTCCGDGSGGCVDEFPTDVCPDTESDGQCPEEGM